MHAKKFIAADCTDATEGGINAVEQIAARLVYDHYKRRASRSGMNHIASFYHLWADKALDGAVNPLVLRVRQLVAAQPKATPKIGDRFEVANGMGGSFIVKLLAKQLDGRWCVRVDMPRNPDWHEYRFDDVAPSSLRPVRADWA